MSWLKDIVKPGIFTRSKRDVRAHVWTKCPACGDMLYTKELHENNSVCPSCGHHHVWQLSDRLDHLMDSGYRAIAVAAPPADPLKFKDRKAYADRLKDALKKSDTDDAFQVVDGEVIGVPVVVCALNFGFMAGSMGTYVGEAIVTAAQHALEVKKPLVLIPASGGARMQEGILSLMQMARTTAAIMDLKDAGLPYLVLLTHPTTGGVTASFAMQGDITLAEPGALIGFAGPRVIEQTIGETLPEGFQRAEYLLDHGMVDRIVARQDQPAEIASILKILMKA